MSVPETPSDFGRREAILASTGENGYAPSNLVTVLEERLRERDSQIADILSGMQRSLADIQGQLTARKIAQLDLGRQGENKNSHARWQEYQELLPRIKNTVAESVPAGATILVASKGDDELLRLPGRTGWHFPQTDTGVYAGHYPATSEAAISHLEDLRGRGAGFLLLPKTAFWWLDHYKEFRQHLQNRYQVLVRREDTCVIFALGTAAAPSRPAPPSSSSQSYQHLVRQVRELASSLLPAKARVLVVSKGDDELLKLPGCKAGHFPQTEKGVYAGHNPTNSAAAVAHLEALRAKGAEYLLLPATAYWWLVHYRDFRRHLETHYRTVTRQQHVCLIVELARK